MATQTTQKPETWNLNLRHGDTWPAICFEVKGKDADGVVTDLTDFTVKEEIKKSRSDSTAKKTLVIGDGFIKEGSKITYDTEVDLLPGTYFSDVQVTLGNGNVYTKYERRIDILPDITT